VLARGLGVDDREARGGRRKRGQRQNSGEHSACGGHDDVSKGKEKKRKRRRERYGDLEETALFHHTFCYHSQATFSALLWLNAVSQHRKAQIFESQKGRKVQVFIGRGLNWILTGT
jgi:hypothetical protein